MKTIMVSLALSLAASSAAPADVPATAVKADYLRSVAPYVDDQVIAVAFIDLARVDVDAVEEQLLKRTPIPDQLRRDVLVPAQLKARTLLNALRAAGCSRLYVIVTMADLRRPRNSLVVAPLAKGGNPRAVAGLLFSGRADGPTARPPGEHRGPEPFDACRLKDACVLAGSETALKRAESLTSTPRPDLVNALSEVSGSVVGGAISLGTDSRRIVREMFPRLPDPFGDVTGALIANSIRWVAFGVDFFPDFHVRLLAETKDTDSATTVRDAVTRGYETLGKMPAVKKILPTYEKLILLVTPRVQGNRLTISLDNKDYSLDRVAEFLVRPIEAACQAAQREHGKSNLKRLALALHSYCDRHKTFPPSASHDAEGHALLSWRVLILPYLDQEQLYKQFHLDESWDSPHNRELIDKMPALFARPGSGLQKEGLANYRAPVGEHLAFSAAKGIPIKAFKGGTSQTLLLVEVAPEHAVIWTKPDGLKVDLDRPLRGLVVEGRGWFLAARADGNVWTIGTNIDPKALRALFTRDGDPWPSRDY